MPRHRRVPGDRRGPTRTRPRYARMTAAGSSFLVTLVAILGGIGVLPSEPATADQASSARQGPPEPDPGRGQISIVGATTPVYRPPVRPTGQDLAPTLPADSGSGRRVVFDMSDQRVWLVGTRGDEDVVRRTYLVSGSVTDNLEPGTYSVYSKSLHAWGVDDSGSMRYMVRFAHGANAAIGFHDIPELDGSQVQSVEELGTPRSHGCIRQWRPDARALWDFAPKGTKVVVLA